MSTKGVRSVTDEISATQTYVDCICSPSAVAPAAREAARTALLDFLACALGGSADPGIKALRAALPDTVSADSGVTLLGSALRMSPQSAALINGYQGHALDFDDVHLSVRGHPSTVILPALLAVAEVEHARADDFLDAYVVGIEATARLGLATGVRQYEAGFHSTATLGCVGAAAAISRLLRLSPHTTAVALGIAATQSGGLRLQFGTQTKPLHAGLAARAAVLAIDLARAGLTGSDRFLDGPIGFTSVYGGDLQNLSLVYEGWGEPWQILEPGLQFKQYACCNATHYAADALLALRAEHGLAAADFESITVRFPPKGDAPLRTTMPATGVEGKFSIEYVMAAGAIMGQLPVSIFEDRPIDSAWLPLMHAVKRCYDESAPPVSTDSATRFSVVTVRTRDGRELSRRVDKPMGTASTASKFLAATGGQPELVQVPQLVTDMNDEADLKRLLRLLTRSPSFPSQELLEP